MLQAGLVQSRASCCSLKWEGVLPACPPYPPAASSGSRPSVQSLHLYPLAPHQYIGIQIPASPGGSCQVSGKYLLRSSRGLGKPQAKLESGRPAAGRERLWAASPQPPLPAGGYLRVPHLRLPPLVAERFPALGHSRLPFAAVAIAVAIAIVISRRAGGPRSRGVVHAGKVPFSGSPQRLPTAAPRSLPGATPPQRAPGIRPRPLNSDRL